MAREWSVVSLPYSDVVKYLAKKGSRQQEKLVILSDPELMLGLLLGDSVAFESQVFVCCPLFVTLFLSRQKL